MGKNKDEKKLSTKNTGRIAIIIIISRVFGGLSLYFFLFFFFLRFTQKVWRHLLKLSNADRVGGAAGSTLSQPSLFEVVEVRCSLVLVWCRLRVSHQRANAESQSEGEIEVEQGGNRGYYYFVNFGG